MRDPSRTISELISLERALIDSSSLIYARSLRLTRVLARAIRLETLSVMCAEVRFRLPPEIIIHDSAALSALCADDVFSAWAAREELAVISEDKAILTEAARAGRPHFNMLMMVELVRMRRTIDETHYARVQKKLYSFAWYSDEVKAYARQIHRMINSQTEKE